MSPSILLWISSSSTSSTPPYSFISISFPYSITYLLISVHPSNIYLQSISHCIQHSLFSSPSLCTSCVVVNNTKNIWHIVCEREEVNKTVLSISIYSLWGMNRNRYPILIHSGLWEKWLSLIGNKAVTALAKRIRLLWPWNKPVRPKTGVCGVVGECIPSYSDVPKRCSIRVISFRAWIDGGIKNGFIDVIGDECLIHFVHD